MKATKRVSVWWSALISMAASTIYQPTANARDKILPSLEGDCSHLEGDAFGFCHAFCDAQHCVRDWKPSCDVLRDKFFEKTGSYSFPCEHAEATRTATATSVREHSHTPTRTHEVNATASRTREG